MKYNMLEWQSKGIGINLFIMLKFILQVEITV